MKIFKIILLSILIGFITSCQNNNELNTETLKINVTLNTSIDLDNSNWLASLFKSFNINNINYVSKNNNDKIGINLNRIDVKKINSLNLEMFEGNGLRNTMGVYDNSNLVADLEKLNIRNIFTNANLLQYISNVPQKSYNESEYDGIINISSPLTESQIIKIITNKLSKNKNKCTVNFLVINKVVKKRVIIPKGPGIETSNGNEGGIIYDPPPPRPKESILQVKIENFEYNPQGRSFQWNYVDDNFNIINKLPDYIDLYLHINENAEKEEVIKLNHDRKEIKFDVNSSDMEKIKLKYQFVNKMTIKLILTNSKTKEKKHYSIPGFYRIACSPSPGIDCGFIKSKNIQW